jgi:hypothetical protein
MGKLARTLLAGILGVTLTTGCFATLVQTGETEVGPARKQQSVTLLWGLKPSTVDASDCPHGVAEAVTSWPLWGFVVAVLTLLLVVPTNTTYACAAE